MLILIAVLCPALVIGQTDPQPDLSPLAYWGIAGFLLSVLLWLLIWLLTAERKAHSALQDRIVNDFVPAFLDSTAQLRETTKALTEAASRPNIDPAEFAEWKLTMRRLKDRLDDDDVRRSRSRNDR